MAECFENKSVSTKTVVTLLLKYTSEYLNFNIICDCKMCGNNNDKTRPNIIKFFFFLLNLVNSSSLRRFDVPIG